MASWSQTFSVNNKYSLTLECSESSYSVANNTSEVAYKLTMATAANSFVGYSDYRTTISVSISGSVVYSYNASRDFNPSAASSYSEVLTSGTVTVAHNTDGSKSCACAASVTVAADTYSPGSASISQTLTLTTIPRASTASWSGDFTIGTGKAITITRASSSFTHKLTFTLGSKTVTPTSSAGTSYTWTPSASDWSGQFPTQTSRTGTFTLSTYNGGTLIGSNSYTFTLKIPDSWKPSVSLSLSPSSDNAFISGTGLYVAGYSKIRAAATATAATGAVIVSYTFSGAFSKTVTTSATSTTQTSGVITTSGSKTVTVTVTDARGRTGTASLSCSYVSYAIPAVSSLAYARGTYSGGTWTASDTGEDLRIVFSASCSLSGSGNVLSWSIGAPVNDSGSSLSSGSSVTRYATGIGSVTAYTVRVTVTDSVGNSATRSVFVPTLEIPFVIDPSKPALGVGAVPQSTRTLELAKTWLLNIGGGIVLPQTTDALTDALALTTGTMKAYRGSGNSYTGTLPSTAYQTGTFLIMAAYSTAIYVLAMPSDASALALNVYNGSSWSGWTELGGGGSGDEISTASFTSSSGTVNAGATGYKDITITRTGYTPLGVVSVTGSGISAMALLECSLRSSTTVRVSVRNVSSAAATFTSYTVTVLYKKN